MSGKKGGVTPGGSNVWNYDVPDVKEFVTPDDRGHYLEDITRHVEVHVGEIDSVLHELVSDQVHVDVLVVRPADDRPHWTFVTSGMSDRPMPMDGLDLENEAEWSRAELVIALPEDRWATWPYRAFPSTEQDYPIGWLKWIAWFPHKFGAWLGPGHTIPAGDPPKPIGPDTAACGFFLWRAVTRPASFDRLVTRDGTAINFYAAYPLHQDEMELKLREGSGALLGLMEKTGLTEIFDAARPSMAGTALS